MKLPKQGKPIRVHLPFELKDDVGVGDVIKRITGAFGIKTCKGCEKRATFLNRHFVLTGRRNTR